MLLDSSLGNADDSNSDELEKFNRSVSQAYTELINSETRFGIFVENEELTQLVHKIKLETLQKLASLSPNCIAKLKGNILDVNRMKEITPIGQQSEKYRELLEAKKEIYAEFRKEMIDNYKELVLITKQFQKLCRNHIYKLIEHQKEGK